MSAYPHPRGYQYAPQSASASHYPPPPSQHQHQQAGPPSHITSSAAPRSASSYGAHGSSSGMGAVQQNALQYSNASTTLPPISATRGHGQSSGTQLPSPHMIAAGTPYAHHQQQHYPPPPQSVHQQQHRYAGGLPTPTSSAPPHHAYPDHGAHPATLPPPRSAGHAQLQPMPDSRATTSAGINAAAAAAAAQLKDDDSLPATSDFVKKLFRMLEDPTFSAVVSWNPTGDAFVVRDMTEFTKTILPRLFKHSNFASFVRQLNKYDFHKVKNPDETFGEHSWTFQHPDFRADRKDMLENIKRKVPAAKKARPSTPNVAPSPPAVANGPSAAPTTNGVHQPPSPPSAVNTSMPTAPPSSIPTPPSAHTSSTFAAQVAQHSSLITTLQNQVADLTRKFENSQRQVNELMNLYQRNLDELVSVRQALAEQDSVLGGFMGYTVGNKAKVEPGLTNGMPPQVATRYLNGTYGQVGQPQAQQHQSADTSPAHSPSSARPRNAGLAEAAQAQAQAHAEAQAQAQAAAQAAHMQAQSEAQAHAAQVHQVAQAQAQAHAQMQAQAAQARAQAQANAQAQAQAAAQQSAQAQANAQMRMKAEAGMMNNYNSPTHVNPQATLANGGAMQMTGMPAEMQQMEAAPIPPPPSDLGAMYGMSNIMPDPSAAAAIASQMPLTPRSYNRAHEAAAAAIGLVPDIADALGNGSMQVVSSADLFANLGMPPSPATMAALSGFEFPVFTLQDSTGAPLMSVGPILQPSSTSPPGNSPPGSSSGPGIRAHKQRRMSKSKSSIPVILWSKTPKVLVVDDDKVSRQLSQKWLSKFGIEAALAENGEEAVKLAKTSQFNLMLMDIVMPVIDGIGATTLIREFNRETPIISMTSNAKPEEILTYYTHGMNDILPKPFNRDSLFALLEKHLNALKGNSKVLVDRPPSPSRPLVQASITEIEDEEESDSEDEVQVTPLEKLNVSTEELGKVVEDLKNFGVDLRANRANGDGQLAPAANGSIPLNGSGAMDLRASQTKRPLDEAQMPDAKRQRYAA